VFEIVKIEIESGFVGLCPMPGKFSSFDEDFLQLVKELPQVVVTCATQPEMMACSATRLPEKLYNSEIKWFHIDVDDFQVPDEFSEEKWNSLLPILKETIFGGGGVILNCVGGCGRSGMFLMRLLLEMGWSRDGALERLRKVRPCAIETDQQLFWAFGNGKKN
jgi:protein-tyrosine phosphatase